MAAPVGEGPRERKRDGRRLRARGQGGSEWATRHAAAAAAAAAAAPAVATTVAARRPARTRRERRRGREAASSAAMAVPKPAAAVALRRRRSMPGARRRLGPRRPRGKASPLLLLPLPLPWGRLTAARWLHRRHRPRVARRRKSMPPRIGRSSSRSVPPTHRSTPPPTPTAPTRPLVRSSVRTVAGRASAAGRGRASSLPQRTPRARATRLRWVWTVTPQRVRGRRSRCGSRR